MSAPDKVYLTPRQTPEGVVWDVHLRPYAGAVAYVLRDLAVSEIRAARKGGNDDGSAYITPSHSKYEEREFTEEQYAEWDKQLAERLARVRNSNDPDGEVI